MPLPWRCAIGREACRAGGGSGTTRTCQSPPLGISAGRSDAADVEGGDVARHPNDTHSVCTCRLAELAEERSRALHVEQVHEHRLAGHKRVQNTVSDGPRGERRGAVRVRASNVDPQTCIRLLEEDAQMERPGEKKIGTQVLRRCWGWSVQDKDMPSGGVGGGPSGKKQGGTILHGTRQIEQHLVQAQGVGGVGAKESA